MNSEINRHFAKFWGTGIWYTRRGICVRMAALVFIALAVFPPWIANLRPFLERPEAQMAFYRAPIWNRPKIDGRWQAFWLVNIDFGRMLLELMATEAFVAALFAKWGKRPHRTNLSELPD